MKCEKIDVANPDLKRRAVVIGGLMFATAVGAYALTPRTSTSLMVEGESLERMVPTNFGKWSTLQDGGATVINNPSLKEVLNQIYADMLSRVYIDDKGTQVMVSLAYGRNQNRDLQVHKPEVCYVSQGFSLNATRKVELNTPLGTIPAMQLEAKMGKRSEPVTYWVRVGGSVIRGWAEQNVARIVAGMQGYIPDGLLVRVSTIDADVQRGFAIQSQFLADLLVALEPRHRAMFVGKSMVQG